MGLVRTVPLSAAIFGAALTALAWSRSYWLSGALLFGVGFGCLQQIAASNTIIQTIVEEDKRGRVLAYYSMAFQGIAPFGSLAAGALAARVGAPRTQMVSGIVCAAGAAWFAALLPTIRRAVGSVFEEKGDVSATVAEG